MNIKLGLIILLTLPFLTAAQDQSASLDGAILSDTGGYDMSKYVNAALQRVRNNWYAVMPEAARKGEKGKVTVVTSSSPWFPVSTVPGTIVPVTSVVTSYSVSVVPPIVAPLGLTSTV